MLYRVYAGSVHMLVVTIKSPGQTGAANLNVCVRLWRGSPKPPKNK